MIEIFDKNSDRYITKGIDNIIPPKTQFTMWAMIDNMIVDSKDYLQVFDLEKVKKGMITCQRIIHHQEVPEYKNSLIMLDLLDIEVVDNIKVFVIDDETHQTMLLAEEY